MKTRRILLLLGAALAVLLSSCEKKTRVDGPKEDGTIWWTNEKLAEGLWLRKFSGTEPITNAPQVIHALDLDLDHSPVRLSFEYSEDKVTVASIAAAKGALAATNASFGAPHTFIKTHGIVWCNLETQPGEDNWWKHECAVWYDGYNNIGFYNFLSKWEDAVDAYRACTQPNLFSGTPMLIEKGGYPAWASSTANRNSTVRRHPRTAIALTKDRRLILLTVDGRWGEKSAGMSCYELRRFLTANFHAYHAMAMDGGGSTTMWIRGKGVINYPCSYPGTGDFTTGEGVTYDHSHQRKLPTFFLLKEVTD